MCSRQGRGVRVVIRASLGPLSPDEHFPLQEHSVILRHIGGWAPHFLNVRPGCHDIVERAYHWKSDAPVIRSESERFRA